MKRRQREEEGDWKDERPDPDLVPRRFLCQSRLFLALPRKRRQREEEGDWKQERPNPDLDVFPRRLLCRSIIHAIMSN